MTSGKDHDELHAKSADVLLKRYESRWNPEIRKELASLFRCREYAKGEELLHQGDLWTRIFFVEQGLLRLFFVRNDGREFNKNFILEGEFVFPVTPIMWTKPSLFGIRCLEPSSVWIAEAEAFRHILDVRNEWKELQLETLVRLTDYKLQREHELLSCDGSQRYKVFCERYPRLAGRIPLSQLATYLGLTDVSLSRIRRRSRA